MRRVERENQLATKAKLSQGCEIGDQWLASSEVHVTAARRRSVPPTERLLTELLQVYEAVARP